MTSQANFAHLNPPRPRQPTDEQRGTFGVALRQLREERRVSQSKVAERAGFDHSAVSRWEAGSRVPSRTAAQRLAAALRLSDADTHRLMAAAGFTSGTDREAVLDAEPALVAALALLANDAMPVDLRDQFREQLFSLSAIYARAGRAGE